MEIIKIKDITHEQFANLFRFNLSEKDDIKNKKNGTMTQIGFEALQPTEWFRYIHEEKKYRITRSVGDGHYVEEHDARTERIEKTFIPFAMHFHYDFIENKDSIKQPEQPYTPAHNELCTILTKNGLGTKAIAVHYNGKISAISIDNEGNADCHFKTEQIEKFLPL